MWTYQRRRVLVWVCVFGFIVELWWNMDSVFVSVWKIKAWWCCEQMSFLKVSLCCVCFWGGGSCVCVVCVCVYVVCVCMGGIPVWATVCMLALRVCYISVCGGWRVYFCELLDIWFILDSKCVYEVIFDFGWKMFFLDDCAWQTQSWKITGELCSLDVRWNCNKLENGHFVIFNFNCTQK